MGAGFEVSAAELRDVESFVTGRAYDLRDAITPVAAEVEDLLGGGWTGSAATTFGQAWSEWHDGSAKILDALGRIGAALGQIADSYAGTDDNLAASYSRIADRLS